MYVCIDGVKILLTSWYRMGKRTNRRELSVKSGSSSSVLFSFVAETSLVFLFMLTLASSAATFLEGVSGRDAVTADIFQKKKLRVSGGDRRN